MLEELVSGVDGSRFEIEDALDRQLGARPLPFPGMDSKLLHLVVFPSSISCCCSVSFSIALFFMFYVQAAPHYYLRLGPGQ